MSEEQRTQRIIFIDIDGVLLPTRMWAAAENFRLLSKKVPVGERAPLLRLDPGSVGLLVRLCELSGAKLVLASNWRMTWQHGLEELRNKLAREGLERHLWVDHWHISETETRIETAYAEWLDWRVTPIQALIINDKPTGAIELQEKKIAQIGPKIGEITPHVDDGLGIPEYRAGLKFFGVADPRLPPSDRVAEVSAVPVQPAKAEKVQTADREPPKELLALLGQSPERAEQDEKSKQVTRPLRPYSPM